MRKEVNIKGGVGGCIPALSQRKPGETATSDLSKQVNENKAMKETKYYSDVTGEEITNQLDAICVTVKHSRASMRLASKPEKLYHLSNDDHDFDTERSNHEFTVYLGDDEKIVMVKEGWRSKVLFFGENTDDSEIEQLMSILENQVFPSDD